MSENIMDCVRCAFYLIETVLILRIAFYVGRDKK